MSDSTSKSPSDVVELRELILGMRAAYANGENAMEYARRVAGSLRNTSLATLIAYDLQAGTYTAAARSDPEIRDRWCAQLAAILGPYVQSQGTLLEVGSGEATTLEGVVRRLPRQPAQALGFDISWSRCKWGQNWLAEHRTSAELFVADLFEIPLADSSIDVVFTSHSIEPNGGNEVQALRELMRVTRQVLVMVEPIYELASKEAQLRMRQHGYVKGLKQVVEDLGFSVSDYRLLDFCSNPLNPSGVIVIEKNAGRGGAVGKEVAWRCPLTKTMLAAYPQGFFSPEAGLLYPTLDGIPLLRSNHAVVASAFGERARSE